MSTGIAAVGIDQFGMDEAAAAQMHAVLLLAFAPQRDADIADAHRLGDLGAPAFLELAGGTPVRRRRVRRRRGRAARSNPLRSNSRSAAHSAR